MSATALARVPMHWVKRGLVYCASGESWWNQAYATEPTVDTSGLDVWRVYFGTRDRENRNRIGFVEVEAGNPHRIMRVASEPILPLGKVGTFDDCGMMPSWIVDYDGIKYLYYTGWNVRNTIPYHLSIGLAISEDGGETFRRWSDGPLFSACVSEPYFSATACVLRDEEQWTCWYTSCTGWEAVGARVEPRYHIKMADSTDGIEWRRRGTVAIDYGSAEEGAVGRPSVLCEDGIFKMWYCYRGLTDYRSNRETSYRIGYAESGDGMCWRRKDDQARIDVAPQGWDAEMVEYPHVFASQGKKYLFYCGNTFGKSGFGYAVLE